MELEFTQLHIRSLRMTFLYGSNPPSVSTLQWPLGHQAHDSIRLVNGGKEMQMQHTFVKCQKYNHVMVILFVTFEACSEDKLDHAFITPMKAGDA